MDLICDMLRALADRRRQEARERLNALLVQLSELEQDADMIDGAITEARESLAEQEKILAELEAMNG